METVSLSFDFTWEPFIVNNRHFNFVEYQRKNIRLNQNQCSHWGYAIYKWEGELLEGEHVEKTGLLIGETEDIRQRLNQYKSGTQVAGNQYWRDKFLTKGIIYYYILKFDKAELTFSNDDVAIITEKDLQSKNMRLVFEQLLVKMELSKEDENVWVVNRMQ